MPRDIGGGPIAPAPVKDPKRPREQPSTQPVGTEPHAQQQKAGNNAIANPVIRETIARNIAHRASQFSTGDIQRHPHTVAALIHSSISNQDLTHIARGLNEMYEYTRAKNSQYAAIHDPDTGMRPGSRFTGEYATEEDAVKAEEMKIRAELAANTRGMQGVVDILGGPSRLPGLTLDDRIRQAAESRVGPQGVAAVAAGFQAPFSVALKWTGETLDDLHLSAIRDVADPTLDVVGQNLGRAGRLLSDIPAAGIMAVSELNGGETDWSALLDFWRLEKHDPSTVAIANISGHNVDDPEFAETAQSLDVVFGAAEQIVLAKVVGAAGEYARTAVPGSGLFDAATIADHNALNGGMFTKLARLYEQSPPETRIGRTLAGTRHMPPTLAKVLSEAYEFGETRTAKILSMKEAFVDFMHSDIKDLVARRKELVAELTTNPENAIAKASLERLNVMIEAVGKREPITQWPKYQEVRGAIKGNPTTTSVGKYIKAIYERRPAKAITDITKFTDNLRDRFRVWDWTDRQRAPRDALRQNAQNLGRVMRRAGVDEATIATRLGEMLDPNTVYSEWYMRMTDNIADAAKSWADPVTVERIRSTLRSDEMFANRGNYDAVRVDPRTGLTEYNRRPIVEKADGTHPPTQMNERAHGARMAPLADIHDIAQSQKVSVLKQNPTVKLLLKAKDNVMATWRGMTIAVRGPAITIQIQSSEGLTAFFTNTPLRGVRRFTDFVLTKLPISEEVQAAVADRLGFADVHQARAWYAKAKLHGDQFGQTLSSYAEETPLRIESPIKDFKRRWMEGLIDPKSAEAQEVFGDVVWQLEHTATDPMSRTLLNFGVENTARLMEGQSGVGAVPIPEGAVRLFSERRGGARIKPGVGIEAAPDAELGRKVVWAQERIEGSNASAVREGTLPEGTDVVEYWMPEAEVRRIGTMGSDQVIHDTIPTDNIIRVWKGGKGAPKGNMDLENWGREVIRNTETDPSYAGMGPGERIREFLSRKESEFETLAGNHPDVLDLMANGRTSKFRMEDPGDELPIIQDELEQIHTNLGDPETPIGQRQSLIERRNALLERGSLPEFTAGKRLKVSKNNRAIAKWLMDEATNGRYELPNNRWRRVKTMGDGGFEDLHRGALSTINKVSYSTMKFFNKDFVRGGFAEAKYAKWLERYRKAGWREVDARAAAGAQAAFEARDWLHDIGNKSSFQRYFRNEMPFYHAVERVAYQWFNKIPNYMGAGFTPLGWAMEMEIVHRTYDALKAVGVINEVYDPNGNKRDSIMLPNPLALLNWLPGFQAPSTLDFFDPATMMFPPAHLLTRPPGLAPQAIFALDKVADLTHAKFLRDFHNELTHDGAFDIRFPGARQATAIWEAVTGDPPPWAIGHSRKYQEYIMGRSRDAALRYAYTDMVNADDPMPNPADFEDRQDYAAARDKWWGRLTQKADEYNTGLAWTYALASESPLSTFQPTTEEEAAWRQFLGDNGLLGKERDEHDWAIIEDYLGEHPESLAYNVGKWDKSSDWSRVNKADEEHGLNAFQEAVSRGEVKLKTYDQYKGALALSQEWNYRHQEEQEALRRAGLGKWNRMSAAQQLLNWGKYVDATQDSWTHFNEFLEENPQAQRYYDSYKTESQAIGDRIHEITADRYRMQPGAYDKAISKAYDDLADVTPYGSTRKQHVAWYRHDVMNDWYNKTQAIRDRIDQLEGSGLPNANDLISKQYDLLRDINANWPAIVGPDGRKYPPPEAVYYASKTAAEQRDYRETWASHPPSWLTPFEYETVYGKADGHVKQYFNWEAIVGRKFDQGTAGMSHNSTEYDAWVKWRDQYLDYLAKTAGTEEIRRLEKAPNIVRLDAAGLVPESEGMNWVIEQSTNVANRLRASGSSMWSSSEEAKYYRGWLEGYITRMRDPRSPLYDARVDQFFTRQALKYHIDYDPALYRFVLFGISPSGTIEIPVDYSSENKAALNGTS